MSGRAVNTSTCQERAKLSSMICASMPASGLTGKLLNTRANRGNRVRQWQAAAFLDERDQLVELRSGVAAGEGDPHGMKQVLALDARLRPDLVHPSLEEFRRNSLDGVHARGKSP